MADHIDGPLYYECMGRTGPVMAFVHPNPMDQSCWMFQMAHMSTWFRCIAIDIPGYGRSPKARDGLTMRTWRKAVGRRSKRSFPRTLRSWSAARSAPPFSPTCTTRGRSKTKALIMCGTGYAPGKEFTAHRIKQYTDRGIGSRWDYTFEDLSPAFRQTPLAMYFADLFAERNAHADLDTIVRQFLALKAPDAAVCVLLDAMPRELLAGVVTGTAHDQRFGFAWPRVVHVGENSGADRAADQDRRLLGKLRLDRLPAALCHVAHGQAVARPRRTAIARNVDGDAAKPGGHVRHLEDPARLVHRVGMHEGHDRPCAAHALVIQRSVDVVGHAAVLPAASRPMVARSVAGVSAGCERIGFEVEKQAPFLMRTCQPFGSMSVLLLRADVEGRAPAASSVLASRLPFHEVRAVGIIAEELHSHASSHVWLATRGRHRASDLALHGPDLRAEGRIVPWQPRAMDPLSWPQYSR